MGPTAPPFVLRRAQAVDALPLAVLATQVWLHTYATEGISAELAAHVQAELTPGRYRALIDDPQVRVELAATADGHPGAGNLLGLAVTQLDTPCPDRPAHRAELRTLYVQEHALRRGIGTRLLHAASAWAQQHTGAPPWLSVNARNARALAFYARHGHVRVGTLHFVLGQGRHENHVLVGPPPGPG
ncbi:MAG: hypothetical protein RLZZ584_1840 [Pseudomonadota bacterium]|jgi:GNAT superfamily N-acetyltransferase